MTSAELYHVIDRDDLRQLCAVEDEQYRLTPEMRATISDKIDPLAYKCLINDLKRTEEKRCKTRMRGSK